MSISAIGNLTLSNKQDVKDNSAVQADDQSQNNSIFANTQTAIQANTFIQMKNNLSVGSSNSIVSSAPPVLSDLEAANKQATGQDSDDDQAKQSLNYLC